ncbi:MAG: GerMN domain-containing protein [Sphaerochaetaceae bacterium]|nr:GerMN domain-containing protein [Sphaerochaetaceae bacterium]
MIEYLGPDKDEKKKKVSHNTLLISLSLIILFIIWTIVMSAIFYPRLKDAYKESDIDALIAKREAANEQLERKVNIALLTKNAIIMEDVITERRGGDIYHDTIEALLHDEIEGKIGIIHPDTRLIGITVSRGICYVDFSRKFLDSKSYNGITATELVNRSLYHFPTIEKVVILIEGERIEKKE